MRKRGKGDPACWFTQAELARLLGVSDQAFYSVWLRKVPPDALKGRGRARRIYGRGFIDELLRLEREKAGPDADIYGEGTSPETERLRRVKRQIAELQLAEMRARLVDVGKIRELLAQAAARFRRSLKVLQRRFGSQAHQVMDDALSDVDRLFRELEERRED